MTKGGDRTGSRWGDLRTRVVSGVILAVLGFGLLASSGVVLRAGLSVLVGLMAWELARLTGHLDEPERNERHAGLTGLVAGLASAGVLLTPVLMDRAGPAPVFAWAGLMVPMVIGWMGAAPRNRWLFVLFMLGIYGAAFGILVTRSNGLALTFWVAGTVVVTDVLGYFAGRRFGGPKFWPSISPKKTWSGTVAGWIGAVIWALIVVLVTGSDAWWMLAVGPLIAFAGQAGDIAESWLKRRVGVKDSSNLIPGHGGVLDRFDAMAGAFLLIGLGALLLAPGAPLPLSVG
ncbi:phosphatidate cytidylyltransferase [Paracoccus sp. S1E-3]|uniref:phosphatidate cytidylyltransferase n=1 Tax=Paracoccus sp. S1E-3 TaxID=2756130 RepID=UPI0015EE8981|nr:phosphatidate cytidylyltransferase [Paracoccus sp. S1E-3]MBA4489732.1 phosphatidate cytidylyltransferase [Paracoccus sp. S1E-3]